MSVQLSGDFSLFEHKAFIFSGGEVQVRLAETVLPRDLTITAHIRNAADLVELIMLKDAIDNTGKHDVALVCPYLPYARQDRVCAPGEAFSARVLARMINVCDFSEVVVWDVHSKVSEVMIRNCRNVPAIEFVQRIHLDHPGFVVAPDKGAKERAQVCANFMGFSVITAEKVRDPATGMITGTKVDCGSIGSADLLIVDDICDGGRTFTELAKVLRPLTTGRISLYVTHGIFSQGQAVFDGLIDDIYTPNLFPNSKPVDRIKVI